MGQEPKSVPAMPQTGLEVTPTRSIYQFADAKVRVTMTFMTPALPDDLDVLSWPLSYITWTVQSVDGTPHEVTLYDSTSSALAVNKTDEKVACGREKTGPLTRPLTLLHAGTEAQPVLGSSGDDHRIDWGYVYAAARARQSDSAIGGNDALLQGFVRDGEIPAEDDTRLPRPVTDEEPALAFLFHLGQVKAKPVTRQVIVAYDEIYSIKYFGTNLRPYWRRNGATPATLLREADKQFPRLEKRCEEFDRELTDDLTRAGGVRYARLCALAYRQCLAACGLAADANNQPLFFTKENTSNGDIATVDVFFPMDPVWILLSPTLAKSTLVPILSYAASWHWKFPNAPHDLGTYPLAPGRDDGGEGMPVEESGNMLILCDAICQADGGRLRRAVVAAIDAMGQVPGAIRIGPGEPALHRRFHGPPGAQRQSVHQSDFGPGRLRRYVPRRGDAPTPPVRPTGQSRRRALDAGGQRRRSFPAGLRQARHLEPKIQSGLGPHPGLERLPAGSGADGSRLLQEDAAALRPAAGFAHETDQDRLVRLERDAGGQRAPTSRR
jgi:hypothetical protein